MTEPTTPAPPVPPGSVRDPRALARRSRTEPGFARHLTGAPGVLGFSIAVAVLAGVLVAWPVPANVRALVLAWGIWMASMVWGATRRPVAVAFLGVQAWWALGVLAGGTFAVLDGYAEIGTWRFRGAISDALVLAAVANAGVWLGAVLARVEGRRRGHAIMRVAVPVSTGRLDRWAAVLVGAGIAALVLFVALAGADLASLNVLTGSARYGDLARSTDGVVIKYLKTLVALAGVGLVVVGLRFGRSHRSWLLPIIVSVPAVLVLSASGGRSWLAVPAVAAVLLWLKVSPHRLARRPGALLVAGAAALFVVASLIGGLRGQTDTKEVDLTAFAAKEAHGGVFAPTVGLLETVPATRPRLNGSSYTEVVALPIPRALWPDKPENDLLGLQLAVFGKNIGASFGFHGELWANFGWPGVVIGSVAFGALLEAVWLRFVRTRRLSSAVLAAGALAVLAQLFTRDYVAGQLAGQFGFVVGIVLLAGRIARHEPARVHGAAVIGRATSRSALMSRSTPDAATRAPT